MDKLHSQLGISEEQLQALYEHPNFNETIQLLEKKNSRFKSLPEEMKRLAMAMFLQGDLDKVSSMWKLFYRRPIPTIQEFLTPEYLGSNASFYIEESPWTHDLRSILSPSSTVLEWAMAGAIGIAKCLGKGTKVIMADGTLRKVEDVKVGEYLLGTNGTKRKVLSTAKGIDDLYKIKQKNAKDYIVNSEHILSLKPSGDRAKNRFGEVHNVKVTDFIEYSNHVKKYELKGYALPGYFNKKPEVWEPYLVGLWLADGTTNRPQYTCHIEETEIINSIKDYAKKENLEIREKYNSEKSIRLDVVGQKGKFLKKLREIKVLENKEIPEEYLTSSFEERAELLAGLLDGDGSLSNATHVICSKFDKLAEQICFLARSLGLKATSSKMFAKCPGFEGRDYNRVFISGNTDLIPNRLPKKKAAPRKQKKDALKRGVEVEYIGKGEYYGFELDGDHLFYLEDFTITHNTSVACIAQLYNVYRVTSLREPSLAMGEGKTKPMALMLLTVTKDKAGELFQVMLNTLKECQYFVEVPNKDYFSQYTSQEFCQYVPYYVNKVEGFDRINFPNNVYIRTGSQKAHTIGSNLFGAIMDEAEFRGSAKKAEEAYDLYAEVLGRVTSRFINSQYKLVCLISSVKHDTGVMAKHVENLKAEKELGRSYVSSYAQWEVKKEYFGSFEKHGHFYVLAGNMSNPSRILDEIEYQQYENNTFLLPDQCRVVKVPKHPDLYTPFLRNPDRALRDQAGVVTSGGERPFDNLTSLEDELLLPELTIVAMVGQKESIFSQLPENELFQKTPDGLKLRRFPNAKRYIHLDLAETGEAGICMSHKEVTSTGIMMYVVDFVAKVVSPTRISQTLIEEFLVDLKEVGNVYIEILSADQYQSTYMRERLDNLHKVAKNVKKIPIGGKTGIEPFLTCASLISEGVVKVGECRELQEQLKGVYIHNDLLQYETNRKDMVDCFIGSLYIALNNSLDVPTNIYETYSKINKASKLKNLKGMKKL